MKQPPAVLAATAIVRALIASGVRSVVICPGSRDAPLIYAFATAADRGLCRIFSRSDERSAAFLALGLSLGADRAPVAVVTTSGTAVANLHPAMLEAAHAGVPLIAVTADRPQRLQGTGANQTTVQAGAFGPATGTVVVPCADPADIEKAVSDAVAGAVRPGDNSPAHLNCPFDDPLVPSGADGSWQDLGDRVEAGEVRPAASAPVAPRSARLTAAQSQRILRTDRTVVIAGSDAGPDAGRLARAQGWPLIREITAGFGPGPCDVPSYREAIDRFFGDGPHGRLEQVVVFGRPTLSRQASALASAPGIRLISIGQMHGGVDRFFDPARRAHLRLEGAPAGWLRDASPSARRSDWLRLWLTGAAAPRAFGASRGEHGLSGRAAVGAVVESLAPGMALVLGPSRAIRHADEAALPPGIAIHSNRGLAGIDGVVSTAIGVAHARPASDTVAVMGDVTFLHDMAGLHRSAGERPLRLSIVVLADGGGTIFRGLEHDAFAESDSRARRAVEQLLVTPPSVRVGSVATALGADYVSVDAEPQLRAAMSDRPGGLRVIEARIVS
ncbi:2-succinyl-5-enolpyruvyl-6-hydroxy-3-cyclohexene-1-carboxylic-acid synthase [Rarobacter incanus]|uniref:2-succinyl-5-enolpyruvyl-6-hydroxy-3-cyclohexene-1-carboxylate synthase n=1 Tax=Rarobacter incanus TaxID=153494 RepID=A0A542SQX8_9MICO|nr:2-succinyl-5-enolpyruvyl-6-hydroxy-3-cyclohexene-1-carboxylic-acid synthase [Rarobacter incanus]TQK77005.1 2-succinyl-5-enolpyruvyl-6-hydroxy-3-cyclohexene-1-carboxylate synthase [Rarobacter incanus]